jgi:hypothetical protein
MDIEDLLLQQVEYSKQIDENVLFSVTNHDSLSDLKKALKIISQNPGKYSNILFVPGIEINSKYTNKALTSPSNFPQTAIQLEILAYGINPFDNNLNKFIGNISKCNEEIVTKIIEDYNMWGLGADINEAKKIYSHLRYMGSPGVINYLRKYIQSKFFAKGWIWQDSNHDAESIIRNRITSLYGRETITYATPSYEKIIEEVHKSGFGICGIAHPGLIDLRNIKVSGEYAIKTLISDIIESGAKFVESNYQYNFSHENNIFEWIKTINTFCDLRYPDILKAGGIDNHGTNIFSRLS